MPLSCEIEIETAKRSVRICGVSQEFANRLLRDCRT